MGTEQDTVDTVAYEIFHGVSGKWALPVMNLLGERTLRFSEVHTAIEGVSHKMLTQTLRGLERDGVVHRRVHPTVPPRVEYSLTEAGQALRGTINGLCGWTRRYLEQIEAARARFG
ncbi:helix-turn-helix domain-containing protein [Amycolatopsis sp. 195334CR]|uniref:winged helix-turn-helix transcriptional regulator n=1 Tax=Amycolatopsis sp. 195334CR TaxID=2814588 RepID=UPI001A906B18|nr:helix-turn-helix domain-containing protein [Amycolatopsis sp. 195334CR]MBN6039460.1 helix-turn-helix transcriptional regulator [Amycolatopsis sp. 195334CR]